MSMSQPTRPVTWRRSALLLSACVALVATSAASGAPNRVVAVDGVRVIDGQVANVHILVAVAPGQSVADAKRRALAGQGARAATPNRIRPPRRSGFSFTGLVWDVLPVTQNYNPRGERVAGESELTATHATWSNAGSRFGFTYGGRTSRCPSLVAECGNQTFDGNNDVAWAALEPGTLGVTWSSSSVDEADMAMTTRVQWSTGCRQVGNAFDAQSVFLHENGHVAGLDHTTDRNAVMFPSYQAARCALGSDDMAGIQTLYP